MRATFLLGLLLLGCGPSVAKPDALRPGVYAAGSREAVRYVVTATRTGALDVVARFPPGSSSRFFVEPGAEPFVRTLAPPSDRVPGEGEPFVIPCEAGCELRYRFDLPAAAERFDHVGYAMRVGEAILAPPSTYLLHARDGDLSRRFELVVHVPEGSRFVTGFAEGRPGEGVVATLADLPGAPYAAIGPMRVHRIAEGGGTVDVALVGPPLDRGDALAVDWVREAARDVAGLLGVPAAPHALVLIDVGPGRSFTLLTALGNGGASIHAPVGRSVHPAAIAEDWRMTHEFVHLGSPGLRDDHDWLSEGLATYLEPIARVRRGRMAEEDMWAELVRSIPLGQPGPGDRGLDRTRTWGRTYWGGALFCLLADVEARRRTGNERSLLDAVRAIHRSGGDMRARWSLDRWIELGDEAIGVPVLRELYLRHRRQAVTVDLPTLWADLGVVPGPQRTVTFDDAAPLATVRRGIGRR